MACQLLTLGERRQGVNRIQQSILTPCDKHRMMDEDGSGKRRAVHPSQVQGGCGMAHLRIIAVGVVSLLLAASAQAGGGPENVLLVVNRESTASRTIANYYQHWRKIPPGNVLTIPWTPTQQTTDVNTFREKILDVVLKEIDKRRLSRQIDYIVYSSDFPTAIDIGADVRDLDKDWPAQLKQVLSSTGSLTGLTYLWQPVMLRANYLNFRSNVYMRRDIPAQKDQATLAFSSQQNFGPEGQLSDEPARRYLLSVMLGVTAGRGNTVDEVLNYLRSAVAADGTRPKGTIYFAKNGDIRSKVRDQFFPGVVRELKGLGVNAEIVDGILPTGKADVQGAMVGAADFSWKSSNSTILPGAICEHFTSYGGIMTPGGRSDAAFGMAALRGGRHERRRRRALCNPRQVSRAGDACTLRPRLLAGRGVLSSGLRAVPTADRRRPAMSAVGQDAEGGGAGQRAGRHGEGQT